MKKRWILNLIDKSKSMEPLIYDVINGYNEFLTNIKNIESEECRWTTVLFNTSEQELNDDLVKNVDSMNLSNYRPDKQTALLDSLGNLCFKILANSVEYEKIILNIFTDGQDNSSIKYTNSAINDILKLIKNKYNFDLNFFCTTEDAFKEAIKFDNINELYFDKNFLKCTRRMSKLSSEDINLHETQFKKLKKND